MALQRWCSRCLPSRRACTACSFGWRFCSLLEVKVKHLGQAMASTACSHMGRIWWTWLPEPAMQRYLFLQQPLLWRRYWLCVLCSAARNGRRCCWLPWLWCTKARATIFTAWRWFRWRIFLPRKRWWHVKIYCLLRFWWYLICRFQSLKSVTLIFATPLYSWQYWQLSSGALYRQ